MIAADRPLLVRDVMTIGVPVCREDETCAAVLQRLERGPSPGVVVALDEDGMACGWLSLRALAAGGERRVAELVEEDIPTIAPHIPALAALQLMHDRGQDFLFLMHDWPGEPRPSAVVCREVVEKRLHIQ